MTRIGHGPWLCIVTLSLLWASRVAAHADESASSPVTTPAETTKQEKAPSEVVVTGTRSPSRDRTTDVTLVQGAKLRDSTRPSMFSALADESAGVYVTSTGTLHGVANGASGGISIRGLSGSPNSQVLVVEDGVADYQGIFGHPIPDAYIPALLEDALIVKGGDSVLYGSNAMGGAILLLSRFRAEDGYEVANDAAYGSYDTIRETASVLARSGRWDLAAAIHTTSTKGHRAGTGGNLLVGTVALRHRFTCALSLILRNKAVHLQGADPGPASHPYVEHYYDVWRDNGSLLLEWRRGGLRLTLVPSLNAGVHRLYDGFLSTDYVGQTRAEAEYRVTRMAEVIFGVEQHHVGGTVQNRAEGEVTPASGINDVSTYGQLSLRPYSGGNAVMGARELYSDKYGTTTLYKAGFRSRLCDGLFAHTRIARNFRQPTLRELYLPFPTANPDLKPEYAINWDAGLGFLAEHWEVSATIYRTDVRNMIRYYGVWPSAEVVNIDHTVFWGVEAAIQLKRVGPLSFFASLDHKDVGRYTRQNPSNKANVRVELGEDFGPNYFGGSVSAEWLSGLYMANYQRDPMDDVFVMNAEIRYRHVEPERKLTLEPYVLLRNLLDRRYAYIADYPMPGFNLLAGLRIGA